MIEVKTDFDKSFRIANSSEGIFVNDELVKYDYEIVGEKKIKFFKGSKIFDAEVLEREGNKITLKVNDTEFNLEVNDHIHQMLEKLGMNTSASMTVKEVKAPMPGTILSVAVEEGSSVSKGDTLLILEAMKMENVIKSPNEGVIDKIHVTQSQNVEKNQLLISFQ